MSSSLLFQEGKLAPREVQRGGGEFTPQHDTTANPSRTATSLTFSSPVHRRTSLTRSALICIIHYIDYNAVADSSNGDGGSTTNASSSLPSASAGAFVSAERLFLQATQAPSASSFNSNRYGTTALSLSQSFSTTANTITRPLALLAASPHCRRALEEHLIGGCVLSPCGSLVLQVRQRGVLANQPAFLSMWTSSPTHLKSERYSKKGQRHQKKRATRRTLPSVVMAECAQELVVTSVNVSINALRFQPTSSSLPSRTSTQSPAPRPQSAQAHLRSPRKTLLASSTASLRSLPQGSGRSPGQRPTSSASTVAATERTSRDNAGPERVHASAGLPSIVATITPSPSSASAPTTRSPVLQSRRVPVSASNTTSTPLLTSSLCALATASASAGRDKGGARRELGRLASSPPPQPTVFPSLTPRPLFSTTSTSFPSAASPPSTTSPLSSASIPPSLQAFCYALWWIRRGPLPVSLSLLRYSEADMHALWRLLRTEALSMNEGGVDGEEVGKVAVMAESHKAQEPDLEVPPLPEKGLHGVKAHVTPIQESSTSPSAFTELHVHGRAAGTALTALLPAHPEVRSVRLTHAGLSSTQLCDLARHCPDVTHLSLAMNDHLCSTSFLCPTPSETSSTRTNTTMTTTATTRASTVVPLSKPPPPPPPSPPSQPYSRTRSPRSSLLLAKLDLSQRSHDGGDDHSTPVASPLSCTNSGVNEGRGGLLIPPLLSLSATSPYAQRASARGHNLSRKRCNEVFAMEEDSGGDTDVAQSARPDLDNDTAPNLSRQVPPLLPPQQQQTPYDTLHNSQVDLFAAEEEGEAEMRLSLWQAAQADAAERRQAVFILKPSDVVLGEVGEEVSGDSGSGGEDIKVRRLTAPAPPLSSSRSRILPNDVGAVVVSCSTDSRVTAMSPVAQDAEGDRPYTSHVLLAGEENRHNTDTVDFIVTVNDGTNASPALPPPASISATTQNTDPLRFHGGSVQLIDAAVAELKTSLGKSSATPLTADKDRKAENGNGSHSSPFKTGPAAPPAHLRRHHHSSSSSRSSRKRHSPHWSETLIDLDLSYTQARDEDVARDLPKLKMLCRLSLEGCIQLTQVRWIPSLRYLRELNLSLSSVQGSALYPLGGCAQLAWLKLEGCASFTSVDQLWADAEVKNRQPSHVTGPKTFITEATTAPAAAARATRVVRHRTGGIPAFTVLPTSAAPSTFLAVGREGGEHDADAAPAEMRTARSSFSSKPSRPSEVLDTASISLLSVLRVLIATSTGLSDAGLLPLQYLEGLECLVIDRCTAITNINVAAQLPSLCTVDASHTSVTAEGLATLRRSRTLRQLRLQGCLALTHLPTFFVEPIHTDGRVDDVAVGDVVYRCGATTHGLSVLDVSLCSNLSAGGVEGLVMDAVTLMRHDAAATDGQHRGTASATAATTTVAAPVSEPANEVEGMKRRTDSVSSSPLFSLPQLRHLLLRSCDAVSQLSALRGFTKVVELDLYHTDVDETALTTATAWWTSLEVLNLASTKVRTLAAWCPSKDTEEEALETRKAAARGDASAHSEEGSHSPENSDVAPQTEFQHSSFPGTSRLPAFACTLRVLTLANTDVTSDGLRALRHFPRLEVLQLSNCRRLTSLSFLGLYNSATPPSQSQQQRAMLRELTITEAAELTNAETFPYLAACSGLRLLSLSGCVRIGGGAQASASASRATSESPSTGRLPPLAEESAITATNKIKGSGSSSEKNSDFAVLRHMGGLTDLNLSKTAVTQDDLRALLMPLPMTASKQTLSTEALDPVCAAARLDLSTTASYLPTTAATHGSPRVFCDEESTNTEEGGDSHSNDFPSAASSSPQRLAGTSLQRIWLRGCRRMDEDGLLAAATEADERASTATTSTPGVSLQEDTALALLASVREVYLSQGRFGGAVLRGLLT